jgi:hypothetical protein
LVGIAEGSVETVTWRTEKINEKGKFDYEKDFSFYFNGVSNRWCVTPFQ